MPHLDRLDVTPGLFVWLHHGQGELVGGHMRCDNLGIKVADASVQPLDVTESVRRCSHSRTAQQQPAGNPTC